MINKNDLHGKFVLYLDKDEKERIGKVMKVSGNYLTVKNCLGVRKRVYMDKVKGRQFRKRGLEEIDWKKNVNLK
jgi:hypothetical protein